MVSNEVVRLLRTEGLPVSPGTIRYAILAGHIERPPMDGAQNFQFDSRHIDQLRQYYRRPRKRGRRPAAVVV